MRWIIAAALTVCAALGASGCGEGLYDLLGATGGPDPLRGDDAFSGLQADRSRAAPTDLAAVMTVIDDEARSARGQAPAFADDTDVIALRRRSVQARLDIDETEYEMVDFAEWGDMVQKQSCSLDIDPDPLFDEYLIPHADKIPVRNQGLRGTCAAFAGIGNVEYTALNPKAGGYDQRTLDLSEQRFYWLSKPECRSSDCGAGSWFGTGFEESTGSKGFPIPLEKDCPYSTSPGDNDTQFPQAASCGTGAARVDRVEQWCGLQGMVDLLHRGYAVPVGSALSGNWERNEGLITKRDYSAAGSVHGGGHAYLVVGYRKLPDMQDEGGLCFMIKNSWGKGWGVNGYACMTVGWIQAVGGDRFVQGFPVATEVTLATGNRGNIEPEPVPEPAPEPEPEPELVWTTSQMIGPDDAYYTVRTARTDDALYLRRPGSEEAPLRLDDANGELRYDGDVVGERGEAITVCTGEWSALCALRRDDEKLFVQFRDRDLRAVKADEIADEKGRWHGLPGGSQPLALFVPNEVNESFALDPKIFLKLGNTAPVRMSLRPTSAITEMSIKLMGLEVGRLDLSEPTASSLCSGRYRDTCRLAGIDRLTVLPGNRRRGKAVRVIE